MFEEGNEVFFGHAHDVHEFVFGFWLVERVLDEVVEDVECVEVEVFFFCL